MTVPSDRKEPKERLRNEALLNPGDPLADDILAVLAVVERYENALRTICDIGETRDVQVARAALAGTEEREAKLDELLRIGEETGEYPLAGTEESDPRFGECGCGAAMDQHGCPHGH